jgi:hypothetical protein
VKYFGHNQVASSFLDWTYLFRLEGLRVGHRRHDAFDGGGPFAAADTLKFVGYGAGATFSQNDATHWQVNFNGGATLSPCLRAGLKNLNETISGVSA